ncbi:MAG: efflux RND transporter periplasmic adaptor subunit [Nitrospirota bacterium]
MGKKNIRWPFYIIAFLVVMNILSIAIVVKKPVYLRSILSSKGKAAAPEIQKEKGGKEDSHKEKKILYWQAPMNPNYISDKPGKSPMGMDLIPVYEGETDAGGGIKIDPQIIQNIGVKTEKVEKRRLKKTIRTVGRITFDERKVTYVHSKISGWVEKLYLNFTGEKVNKDDILLEIYSPELVSSQEEYLLAIKFQKELQDSSYLEISDTSRSLVESARRRLELWDVAEHQIKELEETSEVMKTLHIHSQSEGIVIEKKVQEGSYVTPGMNLYTLADISTVWVYADIYEYEVPWIKVGQKAEMELSYYPGIRYRGRVTFIYPYLDKKTRTVKVRIEFPNPRWELKPEMYANVRLESDLSKRAVTVPSEAVIHSGEREVVIIAKGGGKFEPRDITTGIELEGYYEVVKGLKEGEEIVTSANFLIDSESRLREAINKMLKAKKDKKTDMDKMEHSDMKGKDR